jgi:hypothetical protein
VAHGLIIHRQAVIGCILDFSANINFFRRFFHFRVLERDWREERRWIVAGVLRWIEEEVVISLSISYYYFFNLFNVRTCLLHHISQMI